MKRYEVGTKVENIGDSDGNIGDIGIVTDHYGEDNSWGGNVHVKVGNEAHIWLGVRTKPVDGEEASQDEVVERDDSDARISQLEDDKRELRNHTLRLEAENNKLLVQVARLEGELEVYKRFAPTPDVVTFSRSTAK